MDSQVLKAERGGSTYIVGIDEVGRGPVAGPVAVCITWYKVSDQRKLKKAFPKIGDSKKVPVNRRREYAQKAAELRNDGILHYTIQYASATEIDQKGISVCLHECIERGLKRAEQRGISHKEHIFLDGSLHAPKKFYKQKTIVGGDGKVFAISLASIIAKVSRDEVMEQYDLQYPGYGLEQHKGYGTPEHMRCIKFRGMSPIHRRSFLTKLQ